jgi:capsular polysaccharide biosynthesis protein
VSVLVAVNLSLVFSYFIATPMYESSARFIVSPNLNYVADRDLVNSLEALDKRSLITTYAEVINSPQIINGTILLLNGNPDNYINYTTFVSVLPDTNIINFSVRGPNPQVTTMLANSIGQHAIDFIQGIYVAYDIDFLDKATIPLEPYYPSPVSDAVLALLVGAVIGVGLAVFRDMLTSTLEKLGERKTVDYESQAFSRDYFERRVREEMGSSSGNVLTLGFIFLNGIEAYYDSLPQAYVNRIMLKVNETLKYQLRGNDVVGRWSKLQFSVLLPSTDGEAARQRMARIQEVLNEEFSLEPGDKPHLVFDPRIGLADRQGGEPFQVIVNQAQAALEISMQSDQKINLYKVRPFG